MTASYRATSLPTILTALLVLALCAPVSAQYVKLYDFELDSDPGWVREGEWALGQPGGQGGEVYGYADPSAARIGSNVFGVNLAGDFATTDDPNAPHEQFGRRFSLQAGPFDLSDYRGGVLSFSRWLNTDRLPFTTATVAVSADGTHWTKVWQSEPEGTDDYSWRSVDYDISFVADYQNSVYLRWDYQTGPLAYPHSGWNIDDIEIWAIHDPQQLQMDSGADLEAAGPAGGPFNGATNLYTFHNEGAYSLNWTAGADVDWLSFSPASGLLGSGKSVQVTVSVNALARNLPAGTHQGTISFSDLSNGTIQNYRATLEARPATRLVFTTGPDPVQRSGEALSLRLVALDANGALVTAFDEALTLGASDAGVVLENNGPAIFSGGVWEGQLLLSGHAESLTLRAEAGALAADSSAFALQRYHLVEATAGSGGAISPAGQTEVLEGASLDFLLQPETGYRVAELLLDGQSLGCVSGYCLENITADHSLEARFEIIPPTATQLVFETAPAATQRSGEALSLRLVALDASGALVTAFDEALTLGASDAGVVIQNNGPATFSGGVWEGQLLLSGHVESLTLRAEAGALAADSAAFALQRYHFVEATAGSGGAISPMGRTEVLEGASLDFLLQPETGYRVAELLLDGQSLGCVDGYCLENITADHSLEARFEVLPPAAERLAFDALPARLYSEQPFAVRVTATDNAGATATGFDETPAFVVDAPGVLLEVVSGPASFVDGVWEGSLQLKGRADMLTLDLTAGTLAASSEAFELVRLHKVKSLAAGGGGIQPAGEIEVEEGDAIQFSINADAGYELTDILLDGVPQGPISDFELSQILSDHEVQAVFSPEAGAEIYTLDCQSPHFIITLDPAKPLYAAGEQVTISLEPVHPGFRFTGWSGDATGQEPVLTVTMDGNKTIEPLFEAQTAAAAPAWALYR